MRDLQLGEQLLYGYLAHDIFLVCVERNRVRSKEAFIIRTFASL